MSVAQAPILQFSAPKTSVESEWIWMIPNTIMKQVYTKLSKLNEIKLISFLLGQSDAKSYRFAIAENTVLEATGMDHKAYIKARQGLADIGWITYTPRKELIINIETIMEA